MVKTYCRICEAACGLEAQIDGSRVTSLRPDNSHPVSKGFVCAKGTRFAEVATHPSRVIYPMRRNRCDCDQTELERVSWTAAVDETASRIRAIVERHGPHAVGVYFGNPIAFNSLGSLALMAFLDGVRTRNVYSAGSQDCSNKFAGARILYGSPVIHPVPDFARCDLAVVFGSNPLVSQSSFVRLEGGSRVFQDIVDRGGHVVWIDPRRTESAARWGTHLAIRPGADVWLILALLGLFANDAQPQTGVDGLAEILAFAQSVSVDEAAARTGIAAADILSLADRVRAARSTALHMSVGVNQGGYGTLAYVALHALAYATGNFDRAGGWLVHPAAHAFAAGYTKLGPDHSHSSRIGHFPSVMGALPASILADEILEPGDGQIRGMLVIAGDPLLSVPGGNRLREAFSRLEFLACIDMFENRTGAGADVILPVASWLERWDVALTTVPFQTDSLVQIASATVSPPGEARADAQILRDLAIALGSRRGVWKFLGRNIERWLPSPTYGIRGIAPTPGRYFLRHRLCLWDPALGSDADRLRAAPLANADACPGTWRLLSRRRRLGHNSWLHGAHRDGDAEPHAWIGATDLARLGIPGGGDVVITTESGALSIHAKPAAGLARRTVVVPHGIPGLNVNALIPAGPDTIERLSGMAIMTGIPVRLTRTEPN